MSLHIKTAGITVYIFQHQLLCT